MRDFKVLPQYDYCCNPWKVLENIQTDSKSHDIQQDHLVLDGDATSTDNTIPNLLIAYGSETGTAEAAATSLAKRFKACKPTLCTLNNAAKLHSLKTFTHILIICSTFGKGSPPNNAVDFFQTNLNGKINDHAWFAVLALGSSLYPDFCKAGKDISDKMKAAQAEPIMEIKSVDTSKGNQAEMIQWSYQAKKLILPDSILRSIKASRTNTNAVPPVYTLKWQTGDNVQTIRRANTTENGNLKCTKNVELFDEVHSQMTQRSTRHIEFCLPRDMTYETGDHLSVMPTNSISMVAKLTQCFIHNIERAAVGMGYYQMNFNPQDKQYLEHMGLKLGCSPSAAYVLQQPFYIECLENCEINVHPDQSMTNQSLLRVLQDVVDISFNSAAFMVDFVSMLLAKLDSASISSTEANSFRAIAAPIPNQDNCEEDTDENFRMFKDSYPTVTDLLEDHESLFCKPLQGLEESLINLADVLVLLPKLKPRLYSISSSELVTPRTVSITTGVLNFTNKEKVKVQGVCSNYLASLRPGDQINAKIIKSSFRLPQSNRSPIILIGAGTGLAPYMGFLQEREEYIKQASGMKGDFGKCHLFFGCRSDDEYLYMEKLQTWHSEGLVDLHVAQTREPDKPKKQVQHVLAEQGEDLVELLKSEEKPHVYICGDSRMADSCREAFVDILKTHSDMSNVMAKQMLASLHVDNRWNLDVWGTTKDFDMGIDISSHHPQTLRRSQLAFINNF